MDLYSFIFYVATILSTSLVIVALVQRRKWFKQMEDSRLINSKLNSSRVYKIKAQ